MDAASPDTSLAANQSVQMTDLELRIASATVNMDSAAHTAPMTMAAVKPARPDTTPPMNAPPPIDRFTTQTSNA